MNEIYKITSKTSNKSYIGKTTKGFQKRFNEHINNAKRGQLSHFYNAIRKYGENDFKIEVLETNVDIEVLGDREKYWINTFNTYNGEGYNMNEGGGNGHRPHSEETRKKISEAFSEERKQNQSKKYSGEGNPMFNYKWPEEQLNNKSEKMLGENNPMYGLKGELNPNFGKEKPQSFYDKHKKTWTDDRRKEHSKRLSGENNGMYGKKCSEERAKKISESNKNSKKYICEFCGKETNAGNYTRWHGEKCKNKTETDTLEKAFQLKEMAMQLGSVK